MSFSSEKVIKYEYDMNAARNKIFSLIIENRHCIQALTKEKTKTYSLQLRTEEYNLGELQDILVPAYLKIYHKHDEKTGQEGLTLLECWKIVLESETYATKKLEKVDVLKKLVTCTRAVCSFLRLMPAHKLIGEKSKLNLAFDIEYKIMDKFDKSEFKPGHLLIKEQNLGNFYTENGIFSISVIYAFDLGHLMVKRTNVIEIENYDNYTQESGRQYVRHNSVGNTPISKKSPYHHSKDSKGLLSVPRHTPQLPIGESPLLSLPNNTIQQPPPLLQHIIEKPSSQQQLHNPRTVLERSRDRSNTGGKTAVPRSGGGGADTGYLFPPVANSRKSPELGGSPLATSPFRSISQAHSPSGSSPLLSPGVWNNPLLEDQFTLETPAYPSFNLTQLTSFSPFRDNPMSRSPFSDLEDTPTDDIMSGRSTSLTPVFKVAQWKEMGISPSMRSTTSSTSKITVSSSPVLPRESSEHPESSTVDNFMNVLQNPSPHLLKETEAKLTMADYTATLDKLIGN